MRRPCSCVHHQTTGGVRPNARENDQISPSIAVRTARGDGSRPRHPPVLPERRQSAKLHAGSGFIWGIPVKRDGLPTHCKKWFSYLWLGTTLKKQGGEEMVRAIVCGALLLTSVATASLVLTTHEAFAQSACRQCNFDCRNKAPAEKADCELRRRQCLDRCGKRG